MNIHPVNPFPIQGYSGPEYFCDREKETESLVGALKNGRNVTLFAPRRIGKTGLIRHAFIQMNRDWNAVYDDEQESATFADFTNSFLSAVTNAVARERSLLKKMQDWLLTLRPVLSTNPHTGSVQVEVDFRSAAKERLSIREALHLLDAAGPSLVALDEFQHILNLDSNAEGWLRSEVQGLKSCRFIFSGSQFHLLSAMFQSPKRPFYASTQPLQLSKINTDVYAQFISRLFKKNGKLIRPSEVESMLAWADTNTYNVQLLCNRVFARSGETVSTDDINSCITEIYSENKLSYMALRSSMSRLQWKVLSAVATEGTIKSPTAKDFIGRYDLGSGPSVLRALKYLTDRELVYHYIQEDKTYYQVYDLILMRWLQKK